MSIHNLQLSHHSAYPDLLPRSVSQDNRLWCKPSGLWVSVDGPDDWPAFQRESDWGHENMGYQHRVTLAPDAISAGTTDGTARPAVFGTPRPSPPPSSRPSRSN